MSDTTIPNYPRIFLQPNEAGIGDHTWCQDRINETDIEYVRSDIANDVLASLQRLLLEFDFMVEGGHIPDVRNDVIFDAARSAIAKAKGTP
jgi:hypothetical protein